MYYPWARHHQRYEYPAVHEYVSGKTVLDIGCGVSIEPHILSVGAREIYAVDPALKDLKGYMICIPKVAKPDIIKRYSMSIFAFVRPCDVAVAIEVIEHMSDPDMFLEHIASLCKELFITTPLAETTGKTDNPSHIAEYSHKDFKAMLEKHYTIKDFVYQNSDMSITKHAKPNGSSMCLDHVVQMAWCERKDQ